MDTVIARSTSRMWTAFRTAAGTPILNVEDVVEGRQQTVTILMSEDDVKMFGGLSSCCGIVDELLHRGARISPVIATPAIRYRDQIAA